MFSRKPRAPDGGEIISPVEIFTWQKDGSVTERRRRRARRGGVWVAFASVMLALLVLGARTGIFSSLAASTW
jgi:hypothetical protein